MTSHPLTNESSTISLSASEGAEDLPKRRDTGVAVETNTNPLVFAHARSLEGPKHPSSLRRSESRDLTHGHAGTSMDRPQIQGRYARSTPSSQSSKPCTPEDRPSHLHRSKSLDVMSIAGAAHTPHTHAEPLTGVCPCARARNGMLSRPERWLLSGCSVGCCSGICESGVSSRYKNPERIRYCYRNGSPEGSSYDGSATAGRACGRASTPGRSEGPDAGRVLAGCSSLRGH